MPRKPNAALAASLAPERAKRRAEIMKQYVERQRALGHTQVKLWVPESVVDWMHKMAEQARKMHEVGVDPTANLPSSILPKGAD